MLKSFLFKRDEVWWRRKRGKGRAASSKVEAGFRRKAKKGRRDDDCQRRIKNGGGVEQARHSNLQVRSSFTDSFFLSSRPPPRCRDSTDRIETNASCENDEERKKGKGTVHARRGEGNSKRRKIRQPRPQRKKERTRGVYLPFEPFLKPVKPIFAPPLAFFPPTEPRGTKA
jgi:hypothetical protein